MTACILPLAAAASLAGLVAAGTAVPPADAAPGAPGAPAAPARPAVAGHAITGHAITRVDSTGPVVVDGTGHAYLTWDHLGTGGAGDPVEFCKVPAGGSCTHPLTLPLPAHTTWGDLDLIQPFPVLGGVPGTVLVVDPSYVYSDVAVWTSHDGGSRFTGPQVIGRDSYAGDTDVDDVLRVPDNPQRSINYFSIASFNVGLGYSFTGAGTIGAPDPPSGFTFDTSRVPGGVAGSTLGFSGDQTIDAFWTDADPARLAYFWSPVPGVSGSPGSLEHGPTVITDGAEARLAGGPKGLYLLSLDRGATASRPLHLDVRRWDPSTHRFGAPHLVTTIPVGVDASDQGGLAEDTATGALTVAWPGAGPKGAPVMHVWTARPGSTTFAGPTTAGDIGGGYSGPARVAVHDGRGFVTWQDSGGLEVADLAHQ